LEREEGLKGRKGEKERCWVGIEARVESPSFPWEVESRAGSVYLSVCRKTRSERMGEGEAKDGRRRVDGGWERRREEGGKFERPRGDSEGGAEASLRQPSEPNSPTFINQLIKLHPILSIYG